MVKQYLRKRIVIIGIVVGLLVLAVGADYLWLFHFAPGHSTPPKVIKLSSFSGQRSTEAPLALHRTESTAAMQNPTTMLPWGIALDAPHGYVWVAEPGCEPEPHCASAIPGALGQYAYSDGNPVQSINEPSGYSSPMFVAVDANGNVWFTEPSSDSIGEYTPRSGSWNQWSLKKGASPFDLVFDTHGNIWFTEFGTGAIGFLDTQTHTVVETATPTPNSNPYGITIDPHGDIWFAENENGLGQIGSFTPTASGTIKITEQAIPSSRPHLITADKAGNIWFTNGFLGTIGEYVPSTGASNTFLVYSGVCVPGNCTGTHISGIVVDSSGKVWFTDSLSQRVGYLIPSSGQFVTRTLTTNNAHPYDGLAIDSSGRTWFTQQDALMLTLWPAGTVK